MRNTLTALVVGITFATTLAARAQSQPAAPSATTDYPISAQMQPGQVQVRAMPPDPYAPSSTITATAPTSSYGNGGYGFGSYYAYPAAEVNAVPPARAREVVARAQFDQARTAMYRVVDLIKDDFENSEEYLAALRTEKEAYDQYDAARKRVLRNVQQDSSYQALLQLTREMADKIEALRASHASKSEIATLAAVKLDYATRLSDRENAALAADPAVQDARNKLVDAGRRTAELRSRFSRSVKRDKTFLAARDNFEDSKINYLGADAFWRETVTARDIALDYAWWVHRYDPYTGYGAGFASYYPYRYGRYAYGY
jgi:hypothetical protein